MWGTSSFNTEGAAHFAVFGKLRIFSCSVNTGCVCLPFVKTYHCEGGSLMMMIWVLIFHHTLKAWNCHVVMAFAMVRLTAQTSLSWQSYSNWSVGTVPPLLSTSSSGLIWGFSSSAHIHVDSRHSHLQNRKDSVNSHLELLRTFYSHVVKIIHTSTNL